MRTSAKQKALRLDDTLRCKREPHGHGLAFVVRDGAGDILAVDHWDASSAWRAAFRELVTVS